MYVTEQFKNYKDYALNHLKINKIEYDKALKVFSEMELFDFSFLCNKQIEAINVIKFNKEYENIYYIDTSFKNFSLPFKYCYAKVGDDSSIVIGEQSNNPNVYNISVIFNIETFNVAIPFIYVNEQDFLYIKTKDFENYLSIMKEHYTINKDDENTMLCDLFTYLNNFGLSTFNTLQEHHIITDIPEHEKPEYYAFKDKSKATIKVTNRPIYYVLDKKEDVEIQKKKIKSRGKLEFTHAFKVRGHWRKIDDKSIGKDRSGDYNVQGYTWVIDHIRGEGELVKRVRIVK